MVTWVAAAGATVLAVATGMAYAQQAADDTGSSTGSGEESNAPGAVPGSDDGGFVARRATRQRARRLPGPRLDGGIMYTGATFGTTAQVVVTEPARLDRAVRLLSTRLAELDQVCSRFRAGSQISRLTPVSHRPRNLNSGTQQTSTRRRDPADASGCGHPRR
jgi:hypothetical protein